MKIELQTQIDRYADLLENIEQRVGNKADSIAIMQEIRKDMRMQQIRAQNSSPKQLPVTERQKRFLQSLGVTQFDETLTRQQASQLIKDTIATKEKIQRAIKEPVRI